MPGASGSQTSLTHALDWETPPNDRYVPTVCGQWVDSCEMDRAIARHTAPTCPVCQARIAAHESMDFGEGA